jgi:hypothetical protein
MNREHRTEGAAPRFEAVSAEELTLVSGGSFKSKLIAAAKWAKDHVVVLVGEIIGGAIKGKF